MTISSNLRNIRGMQEYSKASTKEKIVMHMVSFFLSIEFFTLIAFILGAGALVSALSITGFVPYIMEGSTEAVLASLGLGVAACTLGFGSFTVIYFVTKMFKKA